jgi:hypothetical protein
MSVKQKIEDHDSREITGSIHQPHRWITLFHSFLLLAFLVD